MNGENLKVFRATVGERDASGIFAMSFVEDPANESHFVALKKQAPVKLALNKKEQILTGVVLKPEQLIYRNDENGEYYIKFTADDIKKIARKMMKTGIALSTTTHQHSRNLEGNYLTELWIVEDPKRDKAVALGLGELPKGTLMCSYKITSSRYWVNEVMSKRVKGFSLEGFFKHINVTNMNKSKKLGAPTKGGTVKFFASVVRAMLENETEVQAEELVDEATKDETDSGAPFLVFDLSEGGQVFVDETGFATLNGGEAMAAGEHLLADGNVIVIDENSELVQTQDEAAAADPEVPAVEMAAARRRASEFLAAANKKPAKAAKPATKLTAAERQIAELKARITQLEKSPSTAKQLPSDGRVELGANDRNSAMANVIAQRRAREKK